MKRVLISFVFVNVLPVFNMVFANQQSSVYPSQAGATQPNQYQQGYNNGQNGPYNTQNSNNNNVPNWQTQYANQYGGNNNNNGNYNNNQNNNNNVNKNLINNPFLNNTIRKNEKFSAIVYDINKKGKLHKRILGYQPDSNGNLVRPDKYLQKAIVIFFGDWCPNCAKFLTSLSKYLNQLISSGIKIVFISVPSIERIQNWQNPSISDYNEARNKLRSFNIDLTQLDPDSYDAAGNPNNRKDKKVELLLLGDNYSLSDNDIDSLPVMIAVHNSIEQFRGGSDNSLDVVNFEDPTAMRQFQEIWRNNDDDEDDEDDEDDDDEEEEDDDYEEYEEKPKKKRSKSKKKKKNVVKKVISDKKKKKNKQKTKIRINKSAKIRNKTSKIKEDKNRGNCYTSMLNKGCNCSCTKRYPTQVIITKPVTVTQQTAPITTVANTTTIQNTEVDENFIEGEKVSRRKKCIIQRVPVICESRIKKVRNKFRNKIEQSIERYESNRCECPSNR